MNVNVRHDSLERVLELDAVPLLLQGDPRPVAAEHVLAPRHRAGVHCTATRKDLSLALEICSYQSRATFPNE